MQKQYLEILTNLKSIMNSRKKRLKENKKSKKMNHITNNREKTINQYTVARNRKHITYAKEVEVSKSIKTKQE